MGDRVSVDMKFGGKISVEALDRLILELDSERFFEGASASLTSRGVAGVPVADKLSALAGWLHADDINYAYTDGIDGVCQHYKIDFDKRHDAGGGFGACVLRMRDGVLRAYPSDEEGEATIPLSRVLQVETLVSGLADLIAEAKAWAQPLAKLEVVP